MKYRIMPTYGCLTTYYIVQEKFLWFWVDIDSRENFFGSIDDAKEWIDKIESIRIKKTEPIYYDPKKEGKT